MKRPSFIAIEGGEGSGKSSLLHALKEAMGDSIVVTREPGGSAYAELIRDTALKSPLAKGAPPETTLCLMFAARFEHIHNTIRPALREGKHVVTDRFAVSTYAYNVWAQSGGALEDLFWALHERLTIVPDLYIYVDVKPEEGLRRAQGRNQVSDRAQYDHFDDRKAEFHAKVAEGYRKFFAGAKNHIVIDGNAPLETVKADFIAAVRKHIGI